MYVFLKIAATIGSNLLEVGATMRGETVEQFLATRPGRAATDGVSSTAAAFSAALAAAACRATGSLSQQTTRRAPARAAAMPTTPEPQPKSSTVLPATSAGLASR